MTIHLGSDHGGFELKEVIKNFLTNNYFETKDHGPKTLDPEDDYPDYAYPVAKAVAEHNEDLGILLCRSGGGICITANKVKGIRAVVAGNEADAKHAKEHNDANILCLPADSITSDQEAFKIVMAFINTEFAGGRHARRIEKIKEIEETEFK